MTESALLFLVDRTIPGVTAELLSELQVLLHDAALRVSSAGDPVEYVRCTFVPNEARCICLFQAENLAAVRRVNEIAQTPFHRIEVVVEFFAPGAGDHTGTQGRQARLDDGGMGARCG
jgi:Protein of unknown function (DUF4242)